MNIAYGIFQGSWVRRFSNCKHVLQETRTNTPGPTSFSSIGKKIFLLLCRSDWGNATPEVRNLLDEVTAVCNECEEFSSPFWFLEFVPPEKVIFNQEVGIDLTRLDGKPVLHVVCTHTNIRNTTWLESKSARNIWLVFMDCWATDYISNPNKIRGDRDWGVTLDLFPDLTEVNGLELHLSPVEAHNVIGAGETYHVLLRRIYLLIRKYHP